MYKEEIPEKTNIKPEQLVGTKWISSCDLFGGKIMVEFIDKTNCIYTATPFKYPVTYTVAEGEVFIGAIEGPFELRGNVLFNNDLPAFKKAA